MKRTVPPKITSAIVKVSPSSHGPSPMAFSIVPSICS
jgi:hypothetical protein